MKGASIATGISMSLTAALGFYILLRKTPDTYLVKLRPTAELVREMIFQHHSTFYVVKCCP